MPISSLGRAQSCSHNTFASKISKQQVVSTGKGLRDTNGCDPNPNDCAEWYEYVWVTNTWQAGDSSSSSAHVTRLTKTYLKP